MTDGAPAQAYGILVSDFENPFNVQAGEGDDFTLNNNGGTIVARVSRDNGTTWKHGIAIDVRNAPNETSLNFSGNSSIYGNVLLSADDAITIRSGTTTLDGVVNPFEAMAPTTPPETARTAAVIAAAGPVGPLVGTLTVNNGATLLLADQPFNNPAYDGPSAVNVDTFTVASGGTLALQLPSQTLAAAAQAAYPYVNANTATIAGATLRLVLNTPNGLYDDAYFFNDIIDASTLNGKFASVVTNTGSVLLAPSAVYDAFNNVDLRLDRIAFGAVPGLTFNQTAAGNGIENVYSPTQSGPFGTLLANLFLQNSEAAYARALDQLSGHQYAGYVQNLRNDSLQTSTIVSDQLDCAIHRQGYEYCRNPNQGLRLWALGMLNDASVDTDLNAPGYDANNLHALVGLDYTVGNFTLGAFGGYRKDKADFDRDAGHIRADGYQVGLVAGYDIGTFYLRANGSYSDLNGDSTRQLSILSTAGTITSAPDFSIISAYGEAGARFGIGQTWLTPFVGAEYTRVKMKGFTETGVPGANLAFASQSQDQTSLLAGLKWAGNFGGIIPEAKVAYRYDSNGRFFTTTQRFVDAPAGSDFTVRSPETDRGSIMAGLSLAAALTDRVTGRIGYQGRFANDLNDNAFYGSLSVRFGGTPTPPPPPPAVAPPPPPPPPAPVQQPVAQCNQGPYIVFFEWDRADITPEAGTILDNAVSAYANCGSAAVMLAGHADRSGSDRYNVGLSQRRADAARSYMSARGVPDTRISTEAFGESQPRVPTADGVRELQNRRVEITYGPGSGY